MINFTDNGESSLVNDELCSALPRNLRVLYITSAAQSRDSQKDVFLH